MFEPCCLATAIGSMPHAKAADAVRVVLDTIPDAPIWPQLPANGLNEQMEVQYSEGIPRAVVDHDHQRMYIDTTGDYSADLAAFYERYLAEDLEAFAVSSEFSRGIPALEGALAAAGGPRPFVKVQTTGPFTFGLTIVEAMASDRSYRQTPGLEKALEEIGAQKGFLYDSAVVDACLRIFREKDFRLE